MIIQIVKAKEASFWYAGFVGKKFHAHLTPGDSTLLSVEDDEVCHGRYVHKEDCRVIDSTKEA
jgi:hypothetical protein